MGSFRFAQIEECGKVLIPKAEIEFVERRANLAEGGAPPPPGGTISAKGTCPLQVNGVYQAWLEDGTAVEISVWNAKPLREDEFTALFSIVRNLPKREPIQLAGLGYPEPDFEALFTANLPKVPAWQPVDGRIELLGKTLVENVKIEITINVNADSGSQSWSGRLSAAGSNMMEIGSIYRMFLIDGREGDFVLDSSIGLPGGGFFAAFTGRGPVLKKRE